MYPISPQIKHGKLQTLLTVNKQIQPLRTDPRIHQTGMDKKPAVRKMDGPGAKTVRISIGIQIILTKMVANKQLNVRDRPINLHLCLINLKMVQTGIILLIERRPQDLLP
jgi:hypothetical protein